MVSKEDVVQDVVRPQQQSFYLNINEYGLFLCNNIVSFSLPDEGGKGKKK